MSHDQERFEVDDIGSDDPVTIEYWRDRTEQLQAALDSRIVIEQAKGVLAERFGCTPEAAFELIRTLARRQRRKLHDLAAEIVGSVPRSGTQVNAASP